MEKTRKRINVEYLVSVADIRAIRNGYNSKRKVHTAAKLKVRQAGCATVRARST